MHKVFHGSIDGLNVVRLLRIARIFRMTKSLDTYKNWVQLLSEVSVCQKKTTFALQKKNTFV
jgi:hypothetical protein